MGLEWFNKIFGSKVIVLLYLIKYLYQTFLLPPGILIIFLIFCCFWLYRKRIFNFLKVFVVFTAILYISSIPIVADGLIRSLENRYTSPSEVEGDVIIMLGGGATLDTPNVNGFGHLSGYAANRLLTCAQLYQETHASIIISGGQVYEFTGSEAEIAKSILIGLGVPEDKIIPERKSLNTTQNAKYSKELIDQNGFKKPILVTSAFHMHRSLRQFEKVGLSVVPYPSDYQVNVKGRIEVSSFIPSAEAMLKVTIALKEYIGILASKWY